MRLGMSYVVVHALILPEVNGVGFDRVHADEELQLRQTRDALLSVRDCHQWVEALAEQASGLALEHGLEHLQAVVSDIEFRLPVVTELVFRPRLCAIHALKATT